MPVNWVSTRVWYCYSDWWRKPREATVQVNDRVTDVVVATPGRLIDLQRGDVLRSGRITHFDEADRMLDMALFPKLSIVRSTPRKGSSDLIVLRYL